MLIIYFVLSAITGFAGYKAKSLTAGGAITAAIVGSAIAYGFGWKGLLLLGVFFVSSSLWSKYKVKQKEAVEQIVEKGAARDHYQVLANGGAAAFAGIWMGLYPNYWLAVFFLAALATSNADTWASELGVLSKRLPLHILKLKLVPAGTSGAVSVLGLLSSLMGALLIGSLGAVLFEKSLLLLVSVTFGGFLGCLVDTFLGGLIQEEFRCQVCGIKTERHVHCGMKTVKIKGLSGLNNDVVNFLSSITGGIAGGVWFL
ncbi:DUF92 domain-containing protein [Pseudalkalibacillus hwajinpoensis]|uniref:DUF92 domain-containing protein n=1 Tax=Guptibacillus hwajinpoensis TaxID=208199 RepID=UPI00325A66CE